MNLTLDVLARLDRATQYSETIVTEKRSRGVLDAPVKPGHDSLALSHQFQDGKIGTGRIRPG